MAMLLAAAVGATTSIARERDRGEIDRPHLETKLAAHHPRHVEHVVDQPHLRERISIDHLKRPGQHRRLDRAPEQNLGPADDGVERCADLMGQRGKELLLDPPGVLCRGPRLVGCFDLTAELPFAGHAIADVLDHGQRADDGVLEREGRDARVLRHLPADRRAAGEHVAMERVGEKPRLARQRRFVSAARDRAVAKSGNSSNKRAPDCLSGADAGMRFEPAVPAAHDERRVGRKDALPRDLVEPMQKSRIQKIRRGQMSPCS